MEPCALMHAALDMGTRTRRVPLSPPFLLPSEQAREQVACLKSRPASLWSQESLDSCEMLAAGISDMGGGGFTSPSPEHRARYGARCLSLGRDTKAQTHLLSEGQLRRRIPTLPRETSPRAEDGEKVEEQSALHTEAG